MRQSGARFAKKRWSQKRETGSLIQTKVTRGPIRSRAARAFALSSIYGQSNTVSSKHAGDSGERYADLP
jgi:hypothetical protein